MSPMTLHPMPGLRSSTCRSASSRPKQAVLYGLVLATGHGLRPAIRLRPDDGPRRRSAHGRAAGSSMSVLGRCSSPGWCSPASSSSPSLEQSGSSSRPWHCSANLGQLGVELIGAHHVPAGELTLIVSLLPVFVLVLAAVFRTERLTTRKAGGILLGVAASSAILLPSAFGSSCRSVRGWPSRFVAPISQAIGLVLMGKYWPRDLDPLQVATGNLVMGSLLLIPWRCCRASISIRRQFSGGGVLATVLFGLTVAAEFIIFSHPAAARRCGSGELCRFHRGLRWPRLRLHALRRSADAVDGGCRAAVPSRAEVRHRPSRIASCRCGGLPRAGGHARVG